MPSGWTSVRVGSRRGEAVDRCVVRRLGTAAAVLTVIALLGAARSAAGPATEEQASVPAGKLALSVVLSPYQLYEVTLQ